MCIRCNLNHWFSVSINPIFFTFVYFVLIVTINWMAHHILDNICVANTEAIHIFIVWLGRCTVLGHYRNTTENIPIAGWTNRQWWRRWWLCGWYSRWWYNWLQWIRFGYRTTYLMINCSFQAHLVRYMNERAKFINKMDAIRWAYIYGTAMTWQKRVN